MTVSTALRLRQICLLANDLEWTSGMLSAAFDAPVVFRDPRMAAGGDLTNTHIRLGDTFLETVSPSDHAWAKSTTQTRLLERNGDCGYMAIVQVPPRLCPVKARALVSWPEVGISVTGSQGRGWRVLNQVLMNWELLLQSSQTPCLVLTSNFTHVTLVLWRKYRRTGPGRTRFLKTKERIIRLGIHGKMMLMQDLMVE